MGTEIDAYIERLDALRAGLRQAIHGMDAEEFNWAPLEADTNSPCVLATHMAGSERFWLHQVLGGIETRRDRDAEFEAVAPRSEELEVLLVAVGKQSREVLQGVSEAELARERVVRADDRPVDGRYAILHVLEHGGQHLGHLSLTRQLYEVIRGETRPR
jgi:uncharacterized damage-inducible protein DinB